MAGTLTISNAQRKLSTLGLYAGAADGDCGPKTWAALFAHQGARPDLAAQFGAAMAEYGRDIDTPLEVIYFLAQAGHETQGFRYLTEVGGPGYCSRYDCRKDLGNSRPGDGYRFRGRGIFQITGRANYLTMSTKLGVDLLAEPARAAEPEIAIRTALEFWRSRGLGKLAAADYGAEITQRINGGQNGAVDRQTRAAKLKALFA
jgi:putative chitinase